jgi:hypothetical protein
MQTRLLPIAALIGPVFLGQASAETSSIDSACHPAQGEGAAWLDRCTAAAEAGDGAAAYKDQFQ